MKTYYQGKYHNISARDSQRAKLYAAEREAFGDRMHQENRIPLPVMQARCNDITNSETWRKIYQDEFRRITVLRHVELRPGHWCKRALAYRSHIQLPLWARNELVLLHELAHVASGRAHCWIFASVYLDLVSRFSSAADAKLLKAAFRKYRVKYRAPRQLSPERLEALRERGRAALLAWRQRAAKEKQP